MQRPLCGAPRADARACVCVPESSRLAQHCSSLACQRPARQQTRHRLAQLRLHHHGPEPRPGTPGGPTGEVVSRRINNRFIPGDHRRRASPGLLNVFILRSHVNSLETETEKNSIYCRISGFLMSQKALKSHNMFLRSFVFPSFSGMSTSSALWPLTTCVSPTQ